MPGGVFAIDRSFLEFGTKKVNEASDTLSVVITNDGIDTLIFSTITNNSDHFTIINKPAVPFKLPGEGVLALNVVFKPLLGGVQKDTIMIASNDLNVPTYKILLSGNGFQIVKAVPGTLYAATGSVDGGKLYTVNSSAGTATLVTKTEITQIHTLRVHPKSKELYAYNNSGAPNGGALFRISSDGINTQQLAIVPIANLKGLAIYDDSMAYMGAFSGAIYRVNMNTGTATQIGTNGSTQRVGGLAINPVSGTLWMSLRNTGTGGTQDNIYKVDRTTGKSTLVGKANVGIGIVDIIFDKNGKLYGLTGTGTALNTLIAIDTTTGVASLIGDIGKSDMQTIALDPDAIAAVAQQIAGVVPSAFMLEQNYPNPFNPTTTIRFNVPNQSNVVLTVYDVIGREVARLADGIHQAGVYAVQFDATSMSSGVYYYKLTAGTFSDIKKMLILK
ncbi:MAG: T9SS type A sorting domain-containing protein, partial [Bacteriovoracaceae bacterium]